MSDNATLTMLVHGESGTGKSWLGGTAPAPRLVLDSEGRARYLPGGPKVFWDPMRDNPPAAPTAENPWDTCVVTVTDIDTLQRVYQWLASGQHPFKSVVVDSLMEIQKRLIDRIAGQDQLVQQDWGELLRRVEALVRSYRDLTLTPATNVHVVVLIVGTRDTDGVRRPLLQGQIRDTLPYYLDVVGYLYVMADGAGEVVRQLAIQPHPFWVAKDGTGRLGQGPIANPNLTTIYAQLNGSPQEEASS